MREVEDLEELITLIGAHDFDATEALELLLWDANKIIGTPFVGDESDQTILSTESMFLWGNEQEKILEEAILGLLGEKHLPFITRLQAGQGPGFETTIKWEFQTVIQWKIYAGVQ